MTSAVSVFGKCLYVMVATCVVWTENENRNTSFALRLGNWNFLFRTILDAPQCLFVLFEAHHSFFRHPCICNKNKGRYFLWNGQSLAARRCSKYYVKYSFSESSIDMLHRYLFMTQNSACTQWRTEGGVWGVQTPPPPKFRRYRWSPRTHKQEEPASRFPFVVHCVLIQL